MNRKKNFRNVFILIAALFTLLGNVSNSKAQENTQPPVKFIEKNIAPPEQIRDTEGLIEKKGGRLEEVQRFQQSQANAALAQKFAGWKRHRGKPTDTVVHLKVTNYKTGKIETCTGVVLRCDGVILAPLFVQEAYRKENPISVRVTQADGEEVAPFPITGCSKRTTLGADYAVIKLNGHHVPSLPTLSPHLIEKDMPVQIISAVPEGSDRVKAIVQEATVSKLLTEGEDKKRHRWILRGRKGTLENVDLGSLVVDKESGALIGLVAETNDKSPRGVTFDDLSRIMELQADVGLSLTREAARDVPPKESEGMVRVKGGPVYLGYTGIGSLFYSDILIEYTNDYKLTVVCCADFWCDKNLVTGDTYSKWLATHTQWKNTPMVEPKSVPKTEPEIKGEIEIARPSSDTLQGFKDQFPANGTYREALYYLATQDKRLPTFVEWRRIRQPVDPDYVYELLGQSGPSANALQTAQVALVKMVNEVEQINREKQYLDGLFNAADGPSKKRTFTPRTVANWDGYLSTLDKTLTQVFEEQRPPIGLPEEVNGWLNWWPVPVGSRERDRSVDGVMDILGNVEEYRLAHTRPIIGTVVMGIALKPATATVDPFRSVLQDRRPNQAADVPLYRGLDGDMLHRLTVLKTRTAGVTKFAPEVTDTPLERLYRQMMLMAPQPEVRTQPLPVMANALPPGRGFRGVR
jgi:formylglycine-generating enzyme required for sulfatase activity